MAYEDAVVLVPGFLGFGRIGDFYYFADRVAASLRGASEVRFARPTPVLGVAAIPTGGLAERQTDLLERLATVDKTLGGVGRYHLVGHSTGGVDVELLRRERPVQAASWADLDRAGVRRRVATMATIASPHFGTYLAESAVANFLSDPWHHRRAFAETSGLFVELFKLAAGRDLTREALVESLRSSSGAGKFVWEILTDHRLLADLRPEAMVAMRRANPAVLPVVVTCFVTAVPDIPVHPETGPRTPDRFFQLLRELTGKVDESALPSELASNLAALRARAAPLIGNPEVRPPAIDAATSDGIVNSMNQLLTDAGARFGGLVLGDHGDVLGHFDRADPLTNGTPLNDGFFRSGAGFGDDAFFDLYGRVASSFVMHDEDPPRPAQAG